MSKPQEPRSVRRGPEEAATYEVGYGRPPIASRFQPGQCGNPKGRPRKAKSLAAEIERELDAKIIVREGGIARKLPKRTIISRQLADSACRGDLRATRTINDIVNRYGSSRLDTSVAPPPAPPSLDQSDLAIIAAFAALVRGGGAVADEPIATDAAQLSVPSADPDDTAESVSTGAAVH